MRDMKGDRNKLQGKKGPKTIILIFSHLLHGFVIKSFLFTV